VPELTADLAGSVIVRIMIVEALNLRNLSLCEEFSVVDLGFGRVFGVNGRVWV